MNSKLKFCFLNDPDTNNRNKDLDPSMISVLRRLKKCQLVIHKESDNVKILLNTEKLRLYPQPTRFIRLEGQSNHTPGIMNSYDSFEKLSFGYFGMDTALHLPSFPNLQMLHFILVRRSNEKIIQDLSFIKQYSKLQCLGIDLYENKVDNLDFLADLHCLREFSLFSRVSNLKIELPKLSELTKFDLSLAESVRLNIDDLQDFLQRNKSLKTPGLCLSIQTIAAIFKRGQDLHLPQIEVLNLFFVPSQPPWTEAANQMTQVLETHSFIRELNIEIQESSADFNAILMKRGLTKMKALESLSLKFYSSGPKRLEKKFLCLQDAFKNLKSLRALELDLSPETIDSEELSSILEGLCELKLLKKFRLALKFIQLTPIVFGQFLKL